MIREAVWSEIERAREAVWSNPEQIARRLAATGEPGPVPTIHKETAFGVWVRPRKDARGRRESLRRFLKGIQIEWFGRDLLVHQDALYLPAAHNLAVNSGIHISAQRTFNIGGPPAAVDSGGVDNNTTAVAATTDQFDTTGANRFLVAFVSTATYSTANKRITASFQVTNSNTTIVHRRYGLCKGTSNTAGDLFSMLSGFVLDFNGKAYDITVETQTNWTGS